MSDIRSYEPLWGVWKTTELIGQGSFGAVWRAERTDARGFYSAIKHVALPGSEAEIQSLYDEGIVRDERAVDAYYEAMRESLLNEIRFMYVFRDDPNIVTYEDHIAFRHEGAPGYDVFIRMELLKSLGVITRGMDFTPEQACGLGIDICTALVALKRENVIHRDIKPANILVNDKGVFKLADFGVARRMEKTSMVMSKKGTYAYMSPEVYKGEAAGETADLYSLGLVMHRLLNANRAPFLPLTGNVGVDAAEASVARRMNGEEVPYPAYAPPSLGRAICKACAYGPKARFTSPEEFRAALERCLYAPDETVAVVVPPAYKLVPATPVLEAKAAEPAAHVLVAPPAKVQQPPAPVLQPQAQMAFSAPADASGLPYYLRGNHESISLNHNENKRRGLGIAIALIVAVVAFVLLVAAIVSLAR